MHSVMGLPMVTRKPMPARHAPFSVASGGAMPGRKSRP